MSQGWRVNAGGGQYESVSGDIWNADRAYARGQWGCLDMASTDVLSTVDDIAGTEDPHLFQSIRVGEMFRYRFDLDPGRYIVRMLFAEIYWESSDAEAQDVYLNGRKVVTGFNIFDEAGHDRAIEKEYRTTAKNGVVELKFVGCSLPMHSGARVCAISVMED